MHPWAIDALLLLEGIDFYSDVIIDCWFELILPDKLVDVLFLPGIFANDTHIPITTVILCLSVRELGMYFSSSLGVCFEYEGDSLLLPAYALEKTSFGINYITEWTNLLLAIFILTYPCPCCIVQLS